MDKSKSAIGQVVETPIEELAKLLGDKPYGELCTTKKNLEIEYQRVETTKNALVKVANNPAETEDRRKQAQELVDQTYIILQKIEERATLVEVLKKNKKGHSKH